MDKYTNQHGIITFTDNGKDYIFKKGETLELPDTIYVKTLVKKGYVIPQIPKGEQRKNKNNS